LAREEHFWRKPQLWAALLSAACHPPSAVTDSDPSLQACLPEEIDDAQMLENIIDGQASSCEVDAFVALMDELELAQGPWRQSVRAVYSEDPMSFEPDRELELLRPAGVPEIHLAADGRYYLYYLDGDLDHAREVAQSGSDWFRSHGLGGYGALRLAISKDGKHFEVCEDFAVQDLVRGTVADPDLVALDDGSWRLYYMGATVEQLLDPEHWVEGTPHQVYYASSDDLVSWTQQGVAVEGPFADPSVHCQQDECLMWSFGLDLSLSTDGGESFEYQGYQDIWGFAPELFPTEDGQLRMYYNSKRKGAPILSMISSDHGASWEEEEGERVGSHAAEAPSLAEAPMGGWIMYYHFAF